MDTTTEMLVDYSAGFSESDITDTAREATLRHLVDAVSNLIIGTTSPAAKIAAQVASEVHSHPGSTIVGAGAASTPDLATFANVTMIRSWDWQDGMFAKGGAQPSQMLPGLLALGEVIGASPEELLLAMVLAYELLGALGNTIPVRQLQWGQTTFMAPAAALGAGKLLGLNKDQLADTVVFAMCPGLGNNAGMRQAVFAAQLAKAGMSAAIDRTSGSKAPFEGEGGLWSKLPEGIERTELRLPAMPDGPMVIEMSYLKMFPAELHSQALLALVPKIREFTTIDEIESVHIEGYWHLVDSLGSKPSTWDPKNVREAGLSLPFMLLSALKDGVLTPKSFTPERFLDPSLRPLMARFSFREDAEITANYRPPGMEISGNPRSRITIRKKSGEVFFEEVTFHKGHMLNPMSHDDIDAKLDTATAGIIGDEQREKVRSTWWNFEKAANVADAMKTISRFY